MVYRILLIFWISISSYILAGLSTTLIMRLTKGSTANVLSAGCKCSKCGYIIPLYHQFPIVSHLLSNGKCRSCGTKIPVIQFLLEVLVFVAGIISGIICRFSSKTFGLLAIEFIITGAMVIIIVGKRETGFWKQLFQALAGLLLVIALLSVPAWFLELLQIAIE